MNETDDSAERRAALTRMKLIATGILVLAAGVFVIARVLERTQPWAGYLRAAAEAAMVGGLADWFAVTALFRHPLGLKIPHTAIIRTRKNDIGRGLASFVTEHFLTEDVVVERIAEAGVAERAGAWLAEPANSERVARSVLKVGSQVLDTVRDDEIRAALEGAIDRRVRSTPAAPVLARTLELASTDDQHLQLLSVGIRKAADLLIDNRSALRDRLASESPWWVPESIDDRVFARLFDGLMRFVFDLAANPNHELRQQIDVRLAQFIVDLRTDPATAAKADEWKNELLEHAALRNWSTAVWAQVKEQVKSAAADPEPELIERISSSIAELGVRLSTDAELAASVNERVGAFAASAAAASSDEIKRFIESTVERWDPDEAVDRIEVQVGRDLQYIRINGTVVGAVVGLLIHTATQVFGL